MRNFLRTFAGTAAACVLLAAPAVAQHPDFSGTWTFDAMSSQGDNLPTSASKTVVQHGDTLTVDQTTESAMGSTSSHVVYGADGKPWKNTVSAGGQSIELTSIANWSHDTLVVKQTGAVMGNDLEVDDHIFLSADGKTMTDLRAVTVGDQSQPDQTLIYAKKS